MGSAIFGTGSDSPASALRFSTRKPAYLKTARQPRSNTMAKTSTAFLFSRSISSPNAQFAADTPSISRT
ncbi:unknown [Firmicutes bacterium CAG:170]|nr:unknown [Firmicutes bacterium CAG:170]